MTFTKPHTLSICNNFKAVKRLFDPPNGLQKMIWGRFSIELGIARLFLWSAGFLQAVRRDLKALCDINDDTEISAMVKIVQKSNNFKAVNWTSDPPNGLQIMI